VYLIDLTPIHVGIDFNLLRRDRTVLVRADKPECVVGRLFDKIGDARPRLGAMVYTFTPLTIVIVFEKP
jgi:hypothetical protein